MNEAKEYALEMVNQTFNIIGDMYALIPGGNWMAAYVKRSYQNDPGRSLLELVLVVFMIWYFFNKRYAPGQNDVELTEKEIEQLIQGLLIFSDIDTVFRMGT